MPALLFTIPQNAGAETSLVPTRSDLLVNEHLLTSRPPAQLGPIGWFRRLAIGEVPITMAA